MSVTVTTNGTQVAADLGRISGKALKSMISVVEQSAIDMRDEWRANATATAGTHGKHYPKSINYHMVPSFTSVIADIEPSEGMKQAGMSFEFGSTNQPPHLDGQRALDTLAPLIARRIEAALAFS